MVITFDDAEDLIRIVAANPELIARLRPLVLSEELLRMPERLAAFEAATERNLEELNRRMAEKASQAEMDSRFDAVDRRLELMDEKIDRNTATLSGQISDLRTSVHRIGGRASNLDGADLEARYPANFLNWFGDIIDEPQLVAVGQLRRLREARTAGSVSTADWRNVQSLDFRAIGTNPDTGEEMVLAVETSVLIERDDVQRAIDRARILREEGYAVQPAVGGYGIEPDAQQLADAEGVYVDLRRPPE